MRYGTPMRPTDEGDWQIFEQIMQAVRADGGQVSGVTNLMTVAAELGRRQREDRELMDAYRNDARNLLSAVPTHEEAESIYYLLTQSRELPPPDPCWVRTYLPNRHDQATCDCLRCSSRRDNL